MQPLVGPLHDDRTPSICRIAEGHLPSREVSFRETSAAQTLPVPIDDVGTTLLLCIILAATTYEAFFDPAPNVLAITPVIVNTPRATSGCLSRHTPFSEW